MLSAFLIRIVCLRSWSQALRPWAAKQAVVLASEASVVSPAVAQQRYSKPSLLNISLIPRTA